MSARVLRQWPRTVSGAFEWFAWPGGYPIYGITDDGAALCAECVTEDAAECIREAIPGDGWCLVAYTVHEGDDDPDDPLRCDHCGRDIYR